VQAPAASSKAQPNTKTDLRRDAAENISIDWSMIALLLDGFEQQSFNH
jgi:hypothetical protein